MDGIYGQEFVAALMDERERATEKLMRTREALRLTASDRQVAAPARPTIWQRIRSGVFAYGR